MPEPTRYEFLTGEIRRLKLDCDGHIYDIGLHLIEISDGMLYREGGNATLVAYMRNTLDLQEAQAFKAMRVARSYVREDVEQVGIEKCVLYLRWIKLTPEDEVPADIRRAMIPAAGKWVPFVEATVAQIQAAIAALEKSGVPDLSAEGVRLQQTLNAALASFPGARAKVAASLEFSLSGLTPASACAVLASAAGALGCPRAT